MQSLISWLGRIKVPKISLPKLPGLGKSAPAARYTPVGLTGPASRSGAGSVAGRAATTAPGVVINITGPTDPEGAARAIRRVLDRHEQRTGLTGVLRTS